MNDKNFKARIMFRADGNSEIGLGHVYRCVAIAERLKKFFDCYFAIRQPSQEVITVINKTANTIFLHENKSYTEEANDIAMSVIPDYKINITVLDGYCFDTSYQDIIKRNSTSKLISIDDDHPFHYVSDVVINHAPGINADNISTEPYTKVFTGLKYALLRQEFIELLKADRNISSIKEVLICFGGADPNNITLKTLSAVIDSGQFTNINVITGSAYTHSKSLSEACKNYNHIRLYKNLDVEQMISLMQKCQLAIVPASTIALEALTAKMLLLTGTTAGNQQNISSGISKYKGVKNIGDFNLTSKEGITKELVSLNQNFQPICFPASDQIGESDLLSVFNSLL